MKCSKAVVCDPLTKAGNAVFKQRLLNTLKTGWLDLTPTDSSVMKKLAQQKSRMAKSLAKAETKD